MRGVCATLSVKKKQFFFCSAASTYFSFLKRWGLTISMMPTAPWVVVIFGILVQRGSQWGAFFHIFSYQKVGATIDNSCLVGVEFEIVPCWQLGSADFNEVPKSCASETHLGARGSWDGGEGFWLFNGNLWGQCSWRVRTLSMVLTLESWLRRRSVWFDSKIPVTGNSGRKTNGKMAWIPWHDLSRSSAHTKSSQKVGNGNWLIGWLRPWWIAFSRMTPLRSAGEGEGGMWNLWGSRCHADSINSNEAIPCCVYNISFRLCV